VWAREVFRVLYSPLKAFKEIVSKPDIKGPILILVLILVTTAIAQYASASKLSIETAPLATDNWWKESITNWNSNGNVTIINNTGQNFLGNYSIQSISNGTLIWMNKTDIGPFNYSGEAGYKALSFRIKWIHQDGKFPSNATLRLFSPDQNHYFKLNLTDLISNSTDKWANITVNIGSEDSKWLPENLPTWENINGIEFEMRWAVSDSGNLTMIITDLFFGKYISILATNIYGSTILPSIIDGVFVFFLNWAIFAGALMVCTVTFREKVGPWKVFFIVMGYIFSITIVYIIVRTLLISALPELRLQYEAWKAWDPNATEAELRIASGIVTQQIQTYWAPSWIYQLGTYFIFAMDAWTVALSVIAIHVLRETSWKKAVAIALLGYVVYFFLRGLLGL